MVTVGVGIAFDARFCGVGETVAIVTLTTEEFGGGLEIGID